MSETNPKLWGSLGGRRRRYGGAGAALLYCALAARRFSGSAGLGVLLKDVLLLAIAAVGVVAALFGFWLTEGRDRG